MESPLFSISDMARAKSVLTWAEKLMPLIKNKPAYSTPEYVRVKIQGYLDESKTILDGCGKECDPVVLKDMTERHGRIKADFEEIKSAGSK
ncbi:MAG: hypothetical protein MUD12_07900 [Spirochaetes bacterium]|nr:hypothetical protein [Spirochaetota bacterium]